MATLFLFWVTTPCQKPLCLVLSIVPNTLYSISFASERLDPYAVKGSLFMFWNLWARAVNAKYEIIRSITLSSIVLNVPFVTIHWCGCHPQTSPHYTHLFKGRFSLFPAARKPKLHIAWWMEEVTEQKSNLEMRKWNHKVTTLSASLFFRGF